MAPTVSNALYFIILSYLLAVFFAILPLPQDIGWWRPQLLVLMVIYWALVLPEHTSIVLIFCFGILLDLLEGSALGEHALGLMVVAYLCLLTYQRLRNYYLIHQTIFVFVYIGLYQLVGNWVHSLQGNASQSLHFLLPALVSALIWPVVWKFMERIRIQHRIS